MVFILSGAYNDGLVLWPGLEKDQLKSTFVPGQPRGGVKVQYRRIAGDLSKIPVVILSGINENFLPCVKDVGPGWFLSSEEQFHFTLAVPDGPVVGPIYPPIDQTIQWFDAGSGQVSIGGLGNLGHAVDGRAVVIQREPNAQLSLMLYDWYYNLLEEVIIGFDQNVTIFGNTRDGSTNTGIPGPSNYAVSEIWEANPPVPISLTGPNMPVSRIIQQSPTAKNPASQIVYTINSSFINLRPLAQGPIVIPGGFVRTL